MKTLRVGRPEKVRPELEDITLDNQLRRMKQHKKDMFCEVGHRHFIFGPLLGLFRNPWQEQQEAEERATAVSALEQMTLRDLKNKDQFRLENVWVLRGNG